MNSRQRGYRCAHQFRTTSSCDRWSLIEHRQTYARDPTGGQSQSHAELSLGNNHNVETLEQVQQFERALVDSTHPSPRLSFLSLPAHELQLPPRPPQLLPQPSWPLPAPCSFSAAALFAALRTPPRSLSCVAFSSSHRPAAARLRRAGASAPCLCGRHAMCLFVLNLKLELSAHAVTGGVRHVHIVSAAQPAAIIFQPAHAISMSMGAARNRLFILTCTPA